MASGFDRGRWADYFRWGFAPEIATSPEILGLLNETPVRDIAESLVGQTLELMGDPQIALRFPLAPGEAPARVGCHVDGISDNEVYSFTVLAGVLLSDLPIANGGNFTVWPGTHNVVAQWFQENGTRFEQSSVSPLVATRSGNSDLAGERMRNTCVERTSGMVRVTATG